MGKYFAGGVNVYGGLGVGSVATPIKTPMEVNLGTNQIKCVLNSYWQDQYLLYAIFTDGYIYSVGGETTGRNTEWTLVDDTRKYIFGKMLKCTGLSTNTAYDAILIGENKKLYHMSLRANNVSPITYIITSEEYQTDGTYLWGSKYFETLWTFERSVILADSDTVYTVDIPATNILPPPAHTYPISAKSVQVNKYDVASSWGPALYYVINQNNELYSWSSTASGDTYNLINLSGTTMNTTPQLFFSDVKQFQSGAARCFMVKTNGDFFAWGGGVNSLWATMPDVAVGANGLHWDDVKDHPIQNVSSVLQSTWISYNISNLANRRESIIRIQNTGDVYTIGINDNGQCLTGNTTAQTTWYHVATITGANADYTLWRCMQSVYIISPTDVKFTFTVWNAEGTEEITQLPRIPECIKMVLGRYFAVPVILTDTVGDTHTTSIPYNTAREFLGLAAIPNATEPIYEAGGSYDVNFASDVDLYVVLGEIPVGEGFTMNCYNNSAENNRLDKSNYLTPVTDLVGTLKEESSIVSPVIKFYFTGVPRWNYVYINEFHRYYFVHDIVSVVNNIWVMTLICDSIMSFKSAILSIPNPIVSRTASGANQNRNIIDTEATFVNKDEITVIPVENTSLNTYTGTTSTNNVVVSVFAVSRAQPIPTISLSPLSFSYDGNTHIPTVTNLVANTLIIEGYEPQTEIGLYTSRFTPRTGFYWSEFGDSRTLSFTWQIV